MICKFCRWLNARFVPSNYKISQFWDYSRRWEEKQSNDWTLWDADPQNVQDANERAAYLYPKDREASLALYEAMAEKGSVWAMRNAARFHQAGWTGEPNIHRADELYAMAVEGGSKFAVVELARLRFRKSGDTSWREMLESSSVEGFIPASFWLAWLQYRQNPTRKTARAVRNLMEKAASAGHPGAQATLGQWRGRLKFGFKEMLGGYRMHQMAVRRFADDVDAREAEKAKPTASA